MSRFFYKIIAGFFLLIAAHCWAAINFPALTGRVVDDASLLSEQTKQELTQQLAAHEQATSNQIVVVTLPSLQGYPIEDFGYQLGRAWGIGQKDKNNGVLLIVAPKERKVRIEVGYGLEGTLTDALASNIIQTAILPEFRKGQSEAGIVNGVSAILQVLNGSYVPKKIKPRNNDNNSPFILFFILFITIVHMCVMFFGYNPNSSRYKGYSGGGGGFSGGGGFGGGGGFSGGGGSFGGGGASGGW